MTAVSPADNIDVLKGFVGHEVRGDEVSGGIWSMLQYGRSLSGVQHAKDIEAVKMASRQIASEIDQYDIYLTPVMPNLPRALGYYDMNMTDHLEYNRIMGADAVFMFPFIISGQPAMTVPIHWTPDGIPVGVQMVGRNNDEATLIRVSAQLEQARPWKDKRRVICSV